MPDTWVFHTSKPLLRFPNSAAQDSANFANKKLESFLDGLLLSKSSCLFFSFNCQKMKECFISPETSRKHPFWVFLFSCFIQNGGFPLRLSHDLFFSPRDTGCDGVTFPEVVWGSAHSTPLHSCRSITGDLLKASLGRKQEMCSRLLSSLSSSAAASLQKIRVINVALSCPV